MGDSKESHLEIQMVLMGCPAFGSIIIREKAKKMKSKLAFSGEGHRFYEVWKAHNQARLGYAPGAYPDRITRVVSREFSIRLPDYQARGSARAGGVECHIIPRGHGKLLGEPSVRGNVYTYTLTTKFDAPSIMLYIVYSRHISTICCIPWSKRCLSAMKRFHAW